VQAIDTLTHDMKRIQLVATGPSCLPSTQGMLAEPAMTLQRASRLTAARKTPGFGMDTPASSPVRNATASTA